MTHIDIPFTSIVLKSVQNYKRQNLYINYFAYKSIGCAINISYFLMQ